MMMKIASLALLAATFVRADDMNATETETEPMMNITDSVLNIVVNSDAHTTLEKAVLAAPEEIGARLSADTDDGLTLFAPDDDAFAAVDKDTLDLLLTEPYVDHLVCVLTSHAIDYTIPSSDLEGEDEYETLSGYELDIVAGDEVLVDTIPVTAADIMATNGVVHVLSAGIVLPDCVTSNIIDLLEANGDFSTLLGLLADTNLNETIATTAPLTLLAPTDDAFQEAGKEFLDYLGENATALMEVLKYHVIGSLDKLEDGMTYESLEGSDISVTVDGMEVVINDVSVDGDRMLASNGAVYILEEAIRPPGFVVVPPVADTDSPTAAPVINSTILDIVKASEDHKTLAAAVNAAPTAVNDLLDNSGASLTLFAPDDTAFEAVDGDYLETLLTQNWADHLVCVLSSHVIEDSVVLSGDVDGESEVESASGYDLKVEANDDGVFIDEIEVTTPDIMAANGVVHVLSARPILPDCITDTVFDVIANVGSFSTLKSLIDAAGLNETIATLMPLTLLAPSNAAFGDFPDETVEYLGENETALAEVLTYHAINFLEKLEDGMNYVTVEGSNVSVTAEGDDLTINDFADVADGPGRLAKNGVIYTINKVLVPPGFSAPGLDGYGVGGGGGDDNPADAPTSAAASVSALSMVAAIVGFTLWW